MTNTTSPVTDGLSLRQQKRLERDKRRQEKYYLSSQWQLMSRKLLKHKMAMVSFVILGILYLATLFAPFLATQGLEDYSGAYSDAPPSKLYFFRYGEYIGPFTYPYEIERDIYENKIFSLDVTEPYPIRFFVEGVPYKLFGVIPTNVHLFGVDNTARAEGEAPVQFMMFGADKLGRDLYSRILLGAQISLTVPLLGTAISFVLAVLIGGISGYYGGVADVIIQRVIEVLSSFPALPLWMALSAAIPTDFSVPQVFVLITVIMSLLSWPRLARTVRGKFLSLKKEDFVTAAKLAGVSDGKIILGHLVPGFMSYLIVSLTLNIPSMILGETSMSFLGLGMRAPATSWGVLLQECQSIGNIANCPWKLIPVIFVGVTVLAFNFLGDGLRDAADPYR